jgi:hypothetical protein
MGRRSTLRKFKIKVARIERTAVGRSAPEVCITFQMERGAISFQVPVRVRVSDYDDTEAVQAARAILHQTFAELAAQSRDWKLSAKDLRQLSSISLRPGKHSSRVK